MAGFLNTAAGVDETRGGRGEDRRDDASQLAQTMATTINTAPATATLTAIIMVSERSSVEQAQERKDTLRSKK